MRAIRTSVAAAVAATTLLCLGACGTSGGLPTPTTSTSSATSAAPSPVDPSATAGPVAAAATMALAVSDGAVHAQVTAADGRSAVGAVTFTVDGAPLGSASVTGGAASVPLPTGQSVGDHMVAAAFASADPATVMDAQATTGYAVAKAAFSVTAGVGKDAIRYGDTASFDITAAAPGAPAGTDLTGHVAVLDGASVVAEGEVDASGHTVLDVYNTADPGPKTYTARYDGNAAVEASTAEFVVQTTQTNVDIVISWPDDPAPSADVTITADVVGTPQSPSGNATISVDGNQIAAGAVDAKGVVTGTASAVAAGDHTVTVTYAGDVRFGPNTAGATLTVKEPVANPNAAGAAQAQAGNPCPASAEACIDLANEQSWLQSGGKITYGPVPITSGRAGHRTPAGSFSVFFKDRNHLSSLFGDAPMPNSVFFTGDIAFHQGSLSDQSHGCIHLSWDASETYFSTLGIGDTVYVWGAAPY